MAVEVVDCSNSKICLNGKGMVETRMNSKLQSSGSTILDIFPAFGSVYTAVFMLEKRKRTLKPPGPFRKG
jgi:hypothetical protein